MGHVILPNQSANQEADPFCSTTNQIVLQPCPRSIKGVDFSTAFTSLKKSNAIIPQSLSLLKNLIEIEDNSFSLFFSLSVSLIPASSLSITLSLNRKKLGVGSERRVRVKPAPCEAVASRIRILHQGSFSLSLSHS